MTLEMIRSICRSFAGVTEDIKWEDHLCFNVGGKMFLITSPDTVPHSASFKADEEAFEALCSREGFRPAAYLARYQWVYVDDIGRLTRKEGSHLLRRSYELVFAKLPARLRKQVQEQAAAD